VFDELEGILSASKVRHRGGEVGLSVEIHEILEAGEPLRVSARASNGERVALEVVVRDGIGKPIDTIRLADSGGVHQTDFVPPGPDVFQVTVQGAGPARHRVTAVTTAVLVWPPESSFEAELD